MSGAAPLADELGLANRPVGVDCVKWSEDGVLAVAAAHSAVLLSPGDLDGPRAFASPGGTCDPTALQAPGAPARPTEDAHHELAHLRAAAMVSNYPSLQAGLAARSLAWSPAGCSAAAGCLLAAVTNDHQVGARGSPLHFVRLACVACACAASLAGWACRQAAAAAATLPCC